MTPHRSAFSLIELLVVMAVITVLIALVAVTSRMLMASADTVTCANNLRQIGLSLVSYAVDSQGRIPPPNIDNSADLNRNNLIDADEQRDKGNWWGFLRVYLPDVEQSLVFICPNGNWEVKDIRNQQASESDSFKRACRWYNSSYGYNRALGEIGPDMKRWPPFNYTDGTEDPTIVYTADQRAMWDIFPGKNTRWNSWRMASIPRPSETPAITEIWSIDQEGGSTLVTQQPWFTGWLEPVTQTSFVYNAGWVTAIRLSHRKKANHVFYDGSVRPIWPADIRPADVSRFHWDNPNAYRGRY